MVFSLFQHVNNVLHNLNDKVIVPLKKCGLSSFTLVRQYSNQRR